MSPDNSATFARLNAEQIRLAARDQTIGRDVLVLDETSSTNDFVFGIATVATPEGLVVFAEHQTAGRGQHGKRWESAVGKGLWVSILLRPNLPPHESPRLTSWAARTIAETITAEYSLGAIVKPPNDVHLAQRKVAGVLLEMRVIQGGSPLAILGLGVNVNHARADFPEALHDRAGSLAMALGHDVDRQSLAIALLRALDRTYLATVAL